MARYYVSVTGLTLKSSFVYPKFMYHAVPSMMQAQKAAGNVFTQTKAINGCQHTLTVWDDKASMRKFMFSGAHAKAMKATNDLADHGNTKVYGFESDHIPTWDEAIEKWTKHGRLYGKKVGTEAKSLGVTKADAISGTV